MVHVESRRRFVRARKISPTPASPAWVATRMCSTYLDFGAASCRRGALAGVARAAHGDAHLDLGPALDRLLKGAGHGSCARVRPAGSRESRACGRAGCRMLGCRVQVGSACSLRIADSTAAWRTGRRDRIAMLGGSGLPRAGRDAVRGCGSPNGWKEREREEGEKEGTASSRRAGTLAT